jgi:hypothetical protein
LPNDIRAILINNLRLKHRTEQSPSGDPRFPIAREQVVADDPPEGPFLIDWLLKRLRLFHEYFVGEIRTGKLIDRLTKDAIRHHVAVLLVKCMRKS